MDPRSSRPSLLLVSLDCVRRETIGAYGLDSRAKTPVIDLLAARGSRFDNAYCHAPYTPASHASMFTGLLPMRHGIRIISGHQLTPGAVTLAERFRDDGYATGAVVGAHALARSYGLDRGFDHYDDEFQKSKRSWYLGSRRGASEVTRRALEWLNGVPDNQPWCLFVHYFDAHDDGKKPTLRAQRRVVKRLDKHLGKLMRAVDKKNGLRKTVVVVTADHGETFDEHDEWCHRELLFDTTLRVPLILAGPGVRRGVSHLPVGHFDLLPTLLDGMGQAPVPEAEGQSLHGEVAADRFLYAETTLEREPGKWEDLARKLVSVRRGPWKLIKNETDGSVALYRTDKDPLERRNRAMDEPALLVELQRALKRVSAEEVEPTPFGGDDQEKVTAAMKELGYLPD